MEKIKNKLKMLTISLVLIMFLLLSGVTLAGANKEEISSEEEIVPLFEYRTKAAIDQSIEIEVEFLNQQNIESQQGSAASHIGDDWDTVLTIPCIDTVHYQTCCCTCYLDTCDTQPTCQSTCSGDTCEGESTCDYTCFGKTCMYGGSTCGLLCPTCTLSCGPTPTCNPTCTKGQTCYGKHTCFGYSVPTCEGTCFLSCGGSCEVTSCGTTCDTCVPGGLETACKSSCTSAWWCVSP